MKRTYEIIIRPIFQDQPKITFAICENLERVYDLLTFHNFISTGTIEEFKQMYYDNQVCKLAVSQKTDISIEVKALTK
ncbi:hypothetical protein [Xanthovirga aplysinae]|uniref:hypothetical protein n=1 Tax=Xanthovirga aplysinae TaxID=2529853 RepID=UPI0012BB5B66|nr:hypothetical protein [Xanthovirga aplysinae]MTI32635.1 hypothetical protein [Xanthovirga aplysinae]